MIDTTTNAGLTWRSVVLPAPVSGERKNSGPVLSQVVCPNTKDCWAVGNGWKTVRNATGIGPVAVIYATTDGGGTWQAQKTPRTPVGGTSSLTSISCRSVKDCLVIEDNGTMTMPYSDRRPTVLSTTNSGASWVVQKVPASVTGLNAIACSSVSSLCTATGYTGGEDAEHGVIEATKNDGRTWRQVFAAPTLNLDGITCHSTACVVLGTTNSYQQVVVTGPQWAAHPGAPISADGVACPSANKCIAVGSYGTDLRAVVVTTNQAKTWGHVLQM